MPEKLNRMEANKTAHPDAEGAAMSDWQPAIFVKVHSRSRTRMRRDL